MEILIVALFLGSAGLAWAKDLVESTRDLARPRGEEAMKALERAYAVAEIVALATLADGEVSPDEWDALREMAAREGSVEDAAAAVEHLRRLQIPLSTREALEEAVAQRARRLDAAARADAYRLVTQLAARGSRMPGEPAAPRGPRGGYRVAAPTPDVLLEVFAAALAVEPGDRA